MMSTHSSKPTWKHRLEWLALKGVIAYIQSGSVRSTPRKIARLTPLLQKILRSEFQWAQRNLQLIYADTLSEEQRRVLVSLTFENILLSHVEGMQAEAFEFHDSGLEHLQQAIALDRGVLVCSIHLGSWEPGIKHLVDLAAPTPTALVYRHANNPLSEAEFIRVRAPYGADCIRRDQPRQILKAVRDKKVLCLMTDINTREGAITAPFLDFPAQCPSGPARLALQFGTPIVPMVSIRTGPGQALFTALPALIPTPKKGATIEELTELTSQINAAFAPLIHTYAEQYNWLHARWRSKSDGTLWKPDSPIELMRAGRTCPVDAPDPTPGDRVLKLIKARLS
ncbi:MAG: lysophospholipid acyltransferase family protein [Magnetococcales bacterium]|nr:lysophospholipid acyltransferase family protein [Magnetococcales bacterium]